MSPEMMTGAGKGDHVDRVGVPHGTKARSSAFQHRTKWLGRGLLYCILILAGITFIMPFAWAVSASLKAPNEVFTSPIQWIPSGPQWHNYADIFTVLKIGGTETEGGTSAILLFMRNTVVVVTLGTLGTLVSCTLTAYGLTRLHWPGRDFVFMLCLGTMMLPSVVTLVPSFMIFRHLKWINTYLPLVVPAWTASGAFYVFLLRQFFTTLPTDIDEAATVDGASSFRTLWQILLPLLKPAIASVAVFSFVAFYDDFMGPLIYLSSWDKFTMALGLQLFALRQGSFSRPNLLMAATVVSIIPILTVFFAAQRTFVEGIQMTGIAGR